MNSIEIADLETHAIEKTIEILLHVKARPSMFGITTEKDIILFLNGVSLARDVLGIQMPLSIRSQACQELGWQFPSVGPGVAMRAAGLGDERIVELLFDIEIGGLRLMLSAGGTN